MFKHDAINNLDEVITRVESARLSVNDHHIVKIVAVSKYNTSNDIETLYHAGQRAFGENKIQDLKQKTTFLNNNPIEWHFVGRIQKNKINNLIDLSPSLVHSLDSLELADQLNKKLQTKNKTLKCLLQINAAHEITKTGVEPQKAVDIYKTILDQYPCIKLSGVMSIGAHTTDQNEVKRSFDTTRKIFDSLGSTKTARYCSMGMSGDYELAIQHGSNMVRIGSALFKSTPYNKLDP